MRSLLAVAAICVAGSAAAAPLSSYSSYLTFGDSLSDNGNLYRATGNPVSPPYFEGRFSNGPVWSERFAGNFPVSANFAFGGAKAAADADGIPDFAAQIDLFRQARAAGTLPTGARPLASVWFGGNDMFAALTPGGDIEGAIGGAVSGLSGGIAELWAEGVRDILVGNLPSLSLTPGYLGSSDAAALTFAFNTALDAALDGLAASHADLTITRLDVAALNAEIARNPDAFGMTNMTGFCRDAPDCAGYAFFDGVHPTAAAHQVIADRAAGVMTGAVAPVPLPESAALMLAALGVLVLRRR